MSEAAIGVGCLIFGMVIVVLILWVKIKDWEEEDAKTPDQRENERLNLEYGFINAAMICPHCQCKGTVRTKIVDQKMGISGGKATGAILTGGVSLLATGLSRNQQMTKATCCNCKNTWMF